MRTWTKRLAALVGALLLGLGLTAFVGSGFGRSFGGSLAGERLERAEASPNFADGAFVNLEPRDPITATRMWETTARAFTVQSQRTAPSPMPTVPLSAADFAAPPAPGLEVIWLGHATTLIDIEGVRVMTDPMLSLRASPLPFAGPARYHAAPLTIDELPPVDFVVVSHDHYDHLDMATVEALAAQGAVFVVGIGVGAHLEAWGVPAAQRVELDWWQAHEAKGLTLRCLPARHYSGRGPFDQDEALWAGWSLEAGERRVFYSGDTGYSPHFAEIGAKHGPYDLAIVKVGEYDVTWPDIHVNPEEAVAAAVDVRGALMLPVHWGTFNLAYHDWDEPVRRAVAAGEAAGLPVTTPRPGERVVPGAQVPRDAWWESVQ